MNLHSPPQLRLRLLAPAIALVVAATMIPVGLRHPSLTYVDNNFFAPDFINNVILYLPLGIALGGSSLFRAFLFGFSLSTAAELLQLGYVDRIPSLLDVAGNTCGALLGFWACSFFCRITGYSLKSLRVPRLMAAVAMVLAILGTVLLLRHPPKPDFSNWDPTFHLAAGNELTGDRPWVGTISNLAIYAFAMSPSQIDDLAHRASGSAPQVGGNQPSAPPIVELIPPADFATHYGQPFLSQQEEARLFDNLVRENQLTLLVSLRTGNLEQSGPARIVTYSQDTASRNFTLGQNRDTLTFRLRTPTTGWNGTDPALHSGPVLTPDHTSLVAAVYDGRISRLYVDGKCVAQADLGARRPRLHRRVLSWLPGPIPVREIEMGGAEMLLSGLFAIGIFGLAGVPARLSMRLLLGAAAGAVIGGATWVFGVSQPSLGMRILLECIAAGFLIATSVETQPVPGI